MFRTAEECFESDQFKNMMDEVHSYVDVTSSTFPFAQRDFFINDMVFNFALPVGHQLNV